MRLVVSKRKLLGRVFRVLAVLGVRNRCMVAFGTSLRGVVVLLLRQFFARASFFYYSKEFTRVINTGDCSWFCWLNIYTGALISALFFPLNVARIQMQDRIGGPRLSIWQALQSQYIERGHSVKYT